MTDIAWSDDGDVLVDSTGNLQLINDADVVKSDVLARLFTPKGSYWAYVEDGVGLKDYVNATYDDLALLQLSQEVVLETQNNAAVFIANATVQQSDLNTVFIKLEAELFDEQVVSVEFQTR
jgi:hypothetical protein